MRASGLLLLVSVVVSQGCATLCPPISPAERKMFLGVKPEEGGYIINAGDGLQIEVWQNEQLTRAVNVRPDGRISLPLVNDVTAAGQTVPQFQAMLMKRLKTYLKDPIVSVTVTTFSQKQFYMQGAVSNAAAYEYQGDMYLLQALSMAGGANPFAEGAAVIVRRKSRQFLRYCVELEPLLSGASMKENISLLPNDVVTVK